MAYLHWPFVSRFTIFYVLMLVRNPKLADIILQFKIFLILFLNYSTMTNKLMLFYPPAPDANLKAGPSESTCTAMYVHNFQN